MKLVSSVALGAVLMLGAVPTVAGLLAYETGPLPGAVQGYLGRLKRRLKPRP